MVQVEQVAVGPDIGAVVGHEDGHVAEQQDAPRPGGLPELPPLAVEHELVEAVLIQHLVQPFPGLTQRAQVPVAQGFIPGPPGGAAVLLFQGQIKGVVLQPVTVALDELPIQLVLGIRGAGQKTLTRQAQGLAVERVASAPALRHRVQPAPVHQGTLADEIDVAGIDRHALVRGAAVVGLGQGQHLPDAHAAGSEELQETQGIRAQGAHIARPREGGGMEQHAGATLVQG